LTTVLAPARCTAAPLDTVYSAETPEGIALSLNPAGPVARILAYLVDTLIRFGFDKEVQAVLAANAPKFAGAVPPEAEVLLDELIVYGTPGEARRRLARWYEAGAAMPGLMFRPNLTAEETRRSLEAFVPMLESR